MNIQKLQEMAKPRSEEAIKRAEERKAKREDQELLLKDLSARLPYGVIVKTPYNNACLIGITQRKSLKGEVFTDVITDKQTYPLRYNQPYLRPMSSMTEEEMEEMHKVLSPNGTARYKCDGIETPVTHIGDFLPYEYLSRVLDWLLAHHFDYIGLIPKGLAIEVTNDNNPYR